MNEIKPSNRLAAIYVRTSSEHQGEKASPDEQESECRALAQQNNLTVYKIYRDTEKYRVKGRLVDPSGTRVDRPQLLELQKDAAAGRFGYMIAWREDRLYRSMRAMLTVLDTIQDHHIQVLLARESFDPMMAPLKAWVASMELKGMRERMSMGVKARLRNGKANTGQDRYGYRRNGEVIEIVEEEAKWVQKVFEWYNQGIKLMEIRRRLIEARAPQKGSTRLRKIDWAITSIQSILKAADAYYRGVKQQSRDGEVFEIPAPPIIDSKTYERFLIVRERNVKHPMFNYRHDYLVSGLLKCACGRKWVGRTQSSKTRKNRKGEIVPRKTMSSTYCCTQHHKEMIHEDCPRSIGHLKADDYVWGKVKAAIEDPEILIARARDYVDDLSRKAHSATEDNERIQLRPEPAYGTHWHHKPSATQQYLIQIAEAPPASTTERFAARFLSAIVGGSSASRLYWEFIDPGRADSVSLSYEGYEDAGIFVTFLSCAPEMLTENLERLRKVYNQIETDGVTSEELDRVKNKLASALVLAAERPATRLFAIGSERLTTGEYRSIEDDLKIVDTITLDEVNRVAEKYPLNCNATEIVGPIAQPSCELRKTC